MHRHVKRFGFHLKNAFVPHAGNDYHPHAVRSHWLGVYAGLIVTVKIVTVAFVAFYSGPARVSDVTASNIIRLTNDARQANGVATLKTNSALNSAAAAKANDMLQEQYFAHVSPSNLTPWYWFKQAGYAYQYAGENLAIDYLEAEDVINAWLASPSHRENLLASKYQEIGVSVVTGNFQGAQSILVVQMFGTPTVTTTTSAPSSPTQTPTPTQAVATVAGSATPAPAPTPTPAPVVVTPPPPEPPATPTIVSPDPNSVVLTQSPVIVGQAEAGSQVTAQVNDTTIGTATTDSDGAYQITPTNPLSDGDYTIQVVAHARGLDSTPSSRRSFTVDTTPPQVVDSGTFALFSILGHDTYDVFVKTSDDAAQVQCACGSTVTMLHRQANQFMGHITVDGKNSSSSVLSLAVSDAAGNQTKLALVDTDLFTTGVVAPTDSPVIRALRVLTYSRTFLTAFLVFMLLLALFNVIIVWERQHHATVVGMLLVIYLAGSLLLI